MWTIWTASSEFGTYRLCEQRRFRRACASEQSRQNLCCLLIQAVSQEEPSDRKPDPWPLWMACALKICHDGMLEDTNSIDGAHMWVTYCHRKQDCQLQLAVYIWWRMDSQYTGISRSGLGKFHEYKAHIAADSWCSTGLSDMDLRKIRNIDYKSIQISNGHTKIISHTMSSLRALNVYLERGEAVKEW